MIKEIPKKIYSFSQKISPHYSLSSKFKIEGNISSNSLIYNAFIHFHKGDIEKSKILVSKCLYLIKSEILESSNKDTKKHSIFYQNLHKLALLMQLICSIENSFKNVNKLLVDIMNPNDLEIITNKELFIKKIKSLKLLNSWHDSNIIMALFSLRYALLEGNKDDIGLNSCIDYLEKIQNKKTGLWHSINNFGGNLNAMAGTYHYLPLFMAIERPIPKKNKILLSTINLHIINGHFSAPKGHSCIDLDAYSILFYCNNYKNKKLNKVIMDLSKKFIKNISYIINTDGGFSDFPTNYSFYELFLIIKVLLKKFFVYKDYQTFLWNLKAIFRTFPFIKSKLIITSNSDPICSSYINESNTFSCWFKLLTVDYALKINKKIKNKKNLYKLPFIGYGI